MGHGLALMIAPTSVVLVGGLAIAKVGYDKYLRFVWPLLLALVRRVGGHNRRLRDLRSLRPLINGADLADRSESQSDDISQGACPCLFTLSLVDPTISPARAPSSPVLAALALLAGCQREVEQPAPEIRPVRTMTIEKRAAGSSRDDHRHGAGAERSQSSPSASTAGWSSAWSTWATRSRPGS